jgi:arylsulfatase A-like enzyme
MQGAPPSPDSARPARAPGLTRLALACLLAGSLGACSEAGPERAAAERPERSPRPPIVFITVDTLRADAVGARHAGRELTPHLDAFFEDAAVFTRLFVQMPFTLPSQMSIFTGTYPDVHAVHGKGSVLSPSIETLAESLETQGYDTVGFYTNDWLKGDFGFARGFGRYQRLPHSPTYVEDVNRAALTHLESALSAGPAGGDREAGGGPRLFAFLHYLDPHSDFIQRGNRLPYDSPPAVREALGIDVVQDRFCAEDYACATGFLVTADRERIEVDRQRIEELELLYAASVHYLDAGMGELFEGLRELGLYDEALIVFVSDHGEEFREHGRFLHSQTYDESIAVPFAVKFPGNRHAGRRISDLAESVDILPTLLDYLEVPAPATSQGRSLMPRIGSGAKTEAAAGIQAQDKRRRARFAWRTADRKLIYDFRTRTAELYDLAADPAERVDLAEGSPEEVERLLAQLDRRLRRNRRLRSGLEPAETSSEVLTTEETERLRALGYVD